LIQLRLLSNLLDGMVAVASNRTSSIGELFNEIPDRVSDMAVLFGLGYAAGGRPELGYLAALAALLTAYVRAVGKTVGVPGVFAGPMAKQHRMALVTVTAVLCAVLPPEWTDQYRIPAWGAGICFVGALVTVVRRVIIISRHLQIARP
jgi:phosphatidylglycerophosphate synthase